MNKKHTQNIIAESRKTLPITIIYGVGIWLLAGLIDNSWWFQFACFIASIYAMTQLNNTNLMIRVYSRSVSASFILLSCIAVWLFPSIHGAVIQLGTVLVLLILFSCYQDYETRGRTFYIFLISSAISLMIPQYILFIPIIWLLMSTTIYSMCFRTLFASIIGLITPYWLYMGWKLFQNPYNPSVALSFVSRFTEIQWTTNYQALTKPQIIYFILLVILFLVGGIHFWITSYMDKIRVRQIYMSLILITWYTIALLVVLPQMYDVLIYMLTIAVSPIIAHFVSLTHSKISNIFFFVLISVIVLLTGMNLWIS
jgi:hypothetical protein